jgi:hypothetical protein
MNATDETNVTDIELLPDGRICVFGTSLEVLQLLDELQGGLDEKLHRRIEASCNKALASHTLATGDERQPDA